MAKAKKSASKKAAPKKTAKKRAKRKATPAQLAALAKGRAARKAKAKKAAPKKAAKKAAKKRTRKAAPKKAAPKKAAKKRARKAAPKSYAKSAPKRRRRRASARRTTSRPLIGVPPHGPGRSGMQCVKCGRPHTLREHWSHRLLHSTEATQHSYKCARGGLCEFKAIARAKGPRKTALKRAASLITSRATGKKLSLEQEAKIVLLQAKLERASRRK